MAMLILVSAVILIQYYVFGILVGVNRGRRNVPAPAMTGDPVFERYVRVHANTQEQLLITLPSMWMFAQFFSPSIAAALGGVFVIGRVIYFIGYIKDPAKRGAGFILGALGTMVLLGGSLVGATLALL